MTQVRRTRGARTAASLCTAAMLLYMQGACAVVVSFSQDGLDFVIDNSDPFATTISFEAFTQQISSHSATVYRDFETTPPPIPDPLPFPPPPPPQRLKTFQLTVVTDPVEFSMPAVGPLLVTPTSSNTASIEQPVFSAEDVVFPSHLTGTWTLSGPNETVSDTFALPLRGAGWPNRLRDIDQFPDFVEINPAFAFYGKGSNVGGGNNTPGWEIFRAVPLEGELFSGEIFSITLRSGSDQLTVNAGHPEDELGLTRVVPAPAALPLLASVLAVLGCMSRRSGRITS